MSDSRAAFSPPQTPAAKCLHLIRLRELTSRSELVEATGLSQPTITRAVAALSRFGYVVERTDLTRSNGRGRPTIPLALGEPAAIHAGVSVGTLSTYVALFDLKGRTLRSMDIDIPVAQLSEDDFIQHIMAGLNRLTAGVSRPLATVGVTTSGTVTGDGVIYAPNLGWRGVDMGAQLREQFAVPAVVTSAAAAIVGSEAQSHPSLGAPRIMALFADDSLGCAIHTGEGVAPVSVAREDLTTQGLLDALSRPDIGTLVDATRAAQDTPAIRAALDARAGGLGEVAAQLWREHGPDVVVVAGSAFIDDPRAPAQFARTVLADVPGVDLRMIPTHREMVRDIARAAALDAVLREPLSVATSEFDI